MKEFQRKKRLEMEKDIKDVIEKNKLQVSKDLEELVQKEGQTRREVKAFKTEVDRRISELGEDALDLKTELVTRVEAIQSEVRSESWKIRGQMDSFKSEVQLKWDRLQMQYKDQIENFQSIFVFCLF